MFLYKSTRNVDKDITDASKFIKKQILSFENCYIFQSCVPNHFIADFKTVCFIVENVVSVKARKMPKLWISFKKADWLNDLERKFTIQVLLIQRTFI